jgi:hypothetical protein
MARATRSSATQLHPERTRQPAKKRKRTSDGDPAPKQPRIKEEAGDDRKLQSLQLAADVPIEPSDAQQILDILER